MTGRLSKAVRWLLVSPLLACSVALGLVWLTPTNAQALTAPPVPVTTSGPVRTGLKVGATCAAGALGSVAASPLALGCAIVGLGAVAYMTRDTWFPALKGLFNGGSNAQMTNPNNMCTLNVDAFFQDETPRQIVGNLLYSSCSGSLYVRYENPTCRTAAGQYATTTATFSPGNIANAQSSAPGTAPFASPMLCGTGLTLTSVTIYGYAITGNVTGPREFFGDSYPEADQRTTTSVTCKKPDATTFVITATVSGDSGRVDVPSCYAADETSWPIDATIKGGPVGDIPRTYTEWAPHPDFEQDYGDCFNELGLVCTVAVWINGDECAVGDVLCVDWQNYHAGHPSAVKCKFGAYVVAMANCDMLRHSYKTTTIPVTEVEPTTGDPKLPNEPNPPTAPPEVCQVNCVTPPVPDDPENPDGGGDNCLSDAFSWNPVDWVYVPVKCALSWAFVPPTGSWDAAVDRVKVAAEGDSMAQWQDSLGSAFSGVSGGNAGCQGPGFNMPDVLVDGGMPSPFYPFSSCGSTASQVAYWSHLVATVFLVVLAVVKVVELITSGMGLSTHVGIVRGHPWDTNARGEKF